MNEPFAALIELDGRRSPQGRRMAQSRRTWRTQQDRRAAQQQAQSDAAAAADSQLDQLLALPPASCWSDAAAKVRFLLLAYAGTIAASTIEAKGDDQARRRQRLIAVTLDDLDRAQLTDLAAHVTQD